MNIRSFEELAAYLRDFSAWGGEDGGFDCGGAVHLLAASLDCLRKNAVEAEIQEVGEYLDEEQAAFLLKLASQLSKAR